ncbi:MAG: DUF167 domain-containing protein [Gammaproteobacteria bacterium]
MPETFYRHDGETLIVRVRVQPGARNTGVTGVVNGELRLRLSAPATDGRANDMLREFLAERLGTALSRVHIVRGMTSRSKTVAILGAQCEPGGLADA